MRYFSGAAVITLICLLSCGSRNIKPTSRIEVTLSSRVDTSNNTILAIVKLYENYLNSNPSIISDNPYWNKEEKERFADFDFSRESIFQNGMTAEILCKNYQPFIMSVEPIGSKYQIRVMFSSPATEPKYSGSKVWCIQKLNAIYEDGEWVLENLIVELSKFWQNQTVGFIEYNYPVNYQFNFEEANKSISFCENIIERFNPEFKSTFSYYITNNIDEMGLLENFDYYFVGSTKGKARKGMILTAKGNEFYPHEFIHQLLPKNNKRSLIVEEGLATFLGTKQDSKEYKNAYLSKLAQDLRNESTKINFKSVVSQEVRFNGYQTAYPGGAAICELVYIHSGDEGLRKLISADTSSYENLISCLVDITNLSQKELEKEWTKEVLKYGY